MPEHLDHVEEGGILPKEQVNQRALGLMVEIVSALDGLRGSPDFQSWESSYSAEYRFTTPSFLYELLCWSLADHRRMELKRKQYHGNGALAFSETVALTAYGESPSGYIEAQIGVSRAPSAGDPQGEELSNSMAAVSRVEAVVRELCSGI